MKFRKGLLVICFAILFIAFYQVSAKKVKKGRTGKQINLVTDLNGFHSDLHHVIRRDPSLTTTTAYGTHTLEPPSRVNHFSNSNTSNSPNVGSLGHSAEIVGPQIVLHHKQPITTIKETPAHIGYRNENKRITSYNVDTGHVESHDINQKIPIYGNIQEVKTVYKNDVKSYDLEHKRFGPIRSTITEN